MITGRDKVLVFSGCYHGSVEEAHVALQDGRVVMRNGIHPNAVDHARVSKVVEFNDIAALEAALAQRDVACVLAEPLMTNYGMILPIPFHAALRELTRRTGTLLRSTRRTRCRTVPAATPRCMVSSDCSSSAGVGGGIGRPFAPPK
jgi:glutamate-1-semialdehyde 2,1-aminomutase